MAQGWSQYQIHYEALKASATESKEDFPLWQGEPLNGRRIWVRYEQGLGDNLQFIRYLPKVRQLGGTVIYQAKPALLSLLKGFDGIDELIEATPDQKISVACDLRARVLRY